MADDKNLCGCRMNIEIHNDDNRLKGSGNLSVYPLNLLQLPPPPHIPFFSSMQGGGDEVLRSYSSHCSYFLLAMSKCFQPTLKDDERDPGWQPGSLQMQHISYMHILIKSRSQPGFEILA